MTFISSTSLTAGSRTSLPANQTIAGTSSVISSGMASASHRSAPGDTDAASENQRRR
jgi:hypothetical protein